jgi:hypothetical protein
VKNLSESRNRNDETIATDAEANAARSPMPANRSQSQVAPFDRTPGVDQSEGLFLDQTKVRELRERWTAIQTDFVDQPRKAVEDADKLITDTIQHIEQRFAAVRSTLEPEQNRDQVSTEDLRVALQRQRTMLMLLLAI